MTCTQPKTLMPQKRILPGAFGSVYKVILGAISIMLVVLFVISRFSGEGATTGSMFSEVPLAHSIVVVGVVGALTLGGAVPTVPRRL